MSKDKKRLVPVRRFKEFENSAAWEQRKLVSLFSKFTDGDWIESKDQANTGIRLIQTGNIGITEFINKFGNEKWISEETFKKLNCEEIFPGDIIISRLPDPAGRACILPKLDTRMITAVDCTIARTSREASAEFIVQYLSTQTYFKYVQSCLAGGTRQRISRKNLANFNVSIPTEINEQKQIGFFFKQLDTLIALHQRKLDKLKRVKSAYLTEMFPAEGEREPKRRFPGFTGAWEQRKLGEVAKIVGGGTPSTKVKEYWDGDINWYSPVEIGNSIYASGSVKRITELGLEKSSAKILPKGTVLFTSRAGIGNTAILSKEAATNQGFQSIVPKKKLLDSYFIFTETPFLKKYGEINGAGSTFVEVSGKQMAKMPLRLPLLEEQKKIGVFFKQIDSLIALHQRKLDKLKKMKEAYLNEMFV